MGDDGMITLQSPSFETTGPWLQEQDDGLNIYRLWTSRSRDDSLMIYSTRHTNPRELPRWIVLA